MKLTRFRCKLLLLGPALLLREFLFFHRTRKQFVVIGHAHADLDAVGAAYGLAVLLEELIQQGRDPFGLELSSQTRIVLARHGKLRAEIGFLLKQKQFKFRKIGAMASIRGKVVALVDHHHPIQSPPGVEESVVKMVIDHHFPQLELLPAEVKYQWVTVVGSCCTMIVQLYVACGVVIRRDVAVMLLAGLLADTKVAGVNMTSDDWFALHQLVTITGMDMDYKEFGQSLFAVAEKVLVRKKVGELVETDQKQIEVGGARFYTASFQVFDLQSITARTQELYEEMKRRIKMCGYRSCIFMLLDLETYTCKVLIYGEEARVAKALQCGEPDALGWRGVDFGSRKDLERRLKEAYK